MSNKLGSLGLAMAFAVTNSLALSSDYKQAALGSAKRKRGIQVPVIDGPPIYNKTRENTRRAARMAKDTAS